MKTLKPFSLHGGRIVLWVEEPPEGINPSWTFPGVDIELSPELIDFLGMRESLEKLAGELIKKYPRYQGIVIQSLGVSFSHFGRNTNECER